MKQLEQGSRSSCYIKQIQHLVYYSTTELSAAILGALPKL